MIWVPGCTVRYAFSTPNLAKYPNVFGYRKTYTLQGRTLSWIAIILRTCLELGIQNGNRSMVSMTLRHSSAGLSVNQCMCSIRMEMHAYIDHTGFHHFFVTPSARRVILARLLAHRQKQIRLWICLQVALVIECHFWLTRLLKYIFNHVRTYVHVGAAQRAGRHIQHEHDIYCYNDLVRQL